MLTTDDLFELNKTGLKYKIIKCIQHDDGLRFTVKMDHEMKPDLKIEDNVTSLRVLTGGKDGGGNWLASLPKGSVFLCKDNQAKDKETCLLTQFHILSKFTKSALLMSNYPGPDFRVFVEMSLFSQQNQLIEVMQRGEEDDHSHSDDAGLDQS